MDVLKSFAFKSSTSSLKEREKLFDELFLVLDAAKSNKDNELPENAYKFLSKLIYYLFPLYSNKQSNRNLIKLNDYLIKLNEESSLKGLVTSLETHAKTLASIEPNNSSIQLALNGLDLLNGLLISINTNNKSNIDAKNESFVKIAISYANFFLAGSFNMKKKSYDFSQKKFRILMNKISGIETHFSNVFVSIDSADSSYNTIICFCGFLLEILNEKKEASFDKLKELTLDLYLKQIIASRAKSKSYLVKASNYCLKFVNRDEFKDKVLPATQRSLLRNSEIILPTVGHLLQDLFIDLSDFSNDLIATLASHLLAKDENNRQDAVFAIKSLAKQCSNNDSIYNLVKHLFTILSGEGKSSAIEQKTAIFTSIGNCSNSSSSNLQEILPKILILFKDFLKVEAHENTIIVALQQMNIWLENVKLYNVQAETLKVLNEFFKTLLDSKTSSSSVKSVVLQNMALIYASQPNHISNFLTYCNALIEKAQSNTAQNHLINSEALPPSLVLATLLLADPSSETKLSSFISFINDSKKQVFTNNKFLFNLNEQGFKTFNLLFEKLIYINAGKETFNLNNYFYSFSFALLHPTYDIRKNAQVVLKRLIKKVPSSFIITLMNSFVSIVDNYSEITSEQLSADQTNQLSANWPSDKAFSESLKLLCSVKNLTLKEVEEIALKCLVLANNNLAKKIDPNLYEKCLNEIIEQNKEIANLNSYDLISNQMDAIFDIAVSGRKLSENQLNIIGVLSRIDGKKILKKFLDYSLKLLNDKSSELISITKEEYEIMKLKDGDLYDTSLVESVLKQSLEGGQSSNLKRENKAYSYKDQLAELELRKELDAKKAEQQQQHIKKVKENILKNLDQIKSQMTKKQQEVLDQQIQRESKIKEEMKLKDELVSKSVNILLKIIDSNTIQVKNYCAEIVRSLIKFIKSHLCSAYMFRVFDALASKVYLNQGSSKFGSINFNKSLVFCMFRLANAPLNYSADVDGSCWIQEDLGNACIRLLLKIKETTISDIDKQEFDLSMTSFYYPFLKNVMTYFSNQISEESLRNLIESVLKFSNQRNKLQTKILENLSHANLITNNLEQLEEIRESFMSSEYMNLLIGVISVVCERSLNINIQSSSSDACKDLFIYSIKTLFNGQKSCMQIINEHVDIRQKFVNAFRLEILEIIQGLNSSLYPVRENSLNCLMDLINHTYNEIQADTNNKNLNEFFLDEQTYLMLKHGLLLACYDVEPSNRNLADKIWKGGNFKTDQALCTAIAEDCVHPFENFRQSASECLFNIVKDQSNFSEIAKSLMTILIAKYEQLNVVIEPKVDQYGRVSSSDQPIDQWELRSGVALALCNLAQHIPDDDATIMELFTFFVNKALNDRNQVVRNKMLEASIQALNFHGRTKINVLLPLLENFLEQTPKVASYDSVRQNVVILMGTLAKHLEKDDSKVAPIIGKLVQALQTPSQQVQEAVANCLPPLMPSIKTQVPTYVTQLLNLLFSAKTYGERRGAAYGLAGMLKGIGMLSLRQLNVLQRLNEAVNNKEDAKQREGALLAYEMLTIIFNKVFEPYSVEILPNLLLCFGDADANVRQAADDCAKAIMANLTFTGVKMILPKLLERLGEEESWRTKCGSVELLGAMAHCAPKQLSTCLPNIVPKLIEILSDSHIKVQKAGTQALRQIGSVIKNPEIQAITGTLLEALQDPALKTQKALQVLLETKFVHFIDAPSLALIMPVVHRAFQDRSTEIRKMAAQIMGNMYSLTDQKDLLPYLPAILPGLKLSLLDPVPEVRSVSSKALGAMIRAIGENGLNDIIGWLMEKLVSETSSVDRSGAAQGLSEVFGALGVAKLEKSMPEIIERAVQVDLSPFVRDGYIMMFIYLPLTFGENFTPYVGLIIQPILKALADDSEFVRDTAIKAGQRIVNTYADTAISLFLPELEKGLFDTNWRIRFSSVQLLGDLLYKISGVVGKMSTESAHEDDNFGTEKGTAAIVKALGIERRNKVYSGLYMGRSDVSSQVRQAALHVWKIIVSNTPKTLREILPTLFNLLLGCLASVNHDKRQIAASTLVDIVRKLGERVLPDIIPILEHGLNSPKSEQRQGVCIGLTEIMANTSRDNIIAFSDSLVPTVRKALLDPLPEVRQSAARTFDNLHNNIGIKALDEVALFLFEELKRNQFKSDASQEAAAERALDGLKQIMLVKSRALLPYLIPHLTQPPVNVNAMCKLCCCATTDVLSKHLSKILSTLIISLNKVDNSSLMQECESLLLSINDPEGIRTIITELLTHATAVNESESTRLASLDMLIWFCSKTKADISYHLDDLVRSLLSLFADKHEQILVKAWTCLNCVIDPLKGNELLQRLPAVRQSIRLLSKSYSHLSNRLYDFNEVNEHAAYLPGFCINKKGISCILPIFKEGLLNGIPDIKEQSALTLCECIKLSDGESLKSSVMAITGPLIRVLGERYNWTVKSVVLDAIYFLLLKVNITLRPFLPQLQPTFLKNLNDINRTVRLKSGCALAKLLFMNPKLDQIVLDIVNFIKNTSEDEVELKETHLNTLRLCLNNIGQKLQEETKVKCLQMLQTEAFIYNQENTLRCVSAGALGSLSPFLNDKDFENLSNDILDYDKYSTKNLKYLQSNNMILSLIFKYCPSRLLAKFNETKCISFLTNCANSDRTPVVMSALRSICYFIEYSIKNGKKVENEIASTLAKGINHSSVEVKQLSVQIVMYISYKSQTNVLDTNLLKIFLPMLVNGTREKATTVRTDSEIALVNILRLKESNKIYNECLELLVSMRESFTDCVKSISKENLNQVINIQDYQIDETLIRIDS